MTEVRGLGGHPAALAATRGVEILGDHGGRLVLDPSSRNTRFVPTLPLANAARGAA